jgi:hypothetical protein
LARDWREKSDRPHDHELLNIDRSDELRDWLQAVARLLAERYAISRFRVYKAAPAPDTVSSRVLMGPLVMPLFQSGGGFATSDAAWLSTGFLANGNPAVQKALSQDYEPVPEHVTDENPYVGYREVQYGPEGTSRVLFPVHNEDGAPVALFALDRRLHHDEALGGFDWKVVQIATRMARDEAGALSGEQWSLMKVLVEDIGERLTRRLTADEDRREKEWHEAISTAMRDTFSDAGRSPEMTYEGLSQVCAQLSDAWAADKISGHVMGTTPWYQAQGIPPILTWCIALLGDDNRWQSVAGSGAVCEECRREGQQGLVEPHRTAAKTGAWQAIVIQDFQRWLENAGTSVYACLSPAQRQQIRSWLAVPTQVDGKVRALMIAHSPHAYYFSAFRVRLMEHAAKRLLPLLAAAQREIRTRSAFAAAVMHEVKHDSHAALLLLNQVMVETALKPPSQALTEVVHYVEGLNALGQAASLPADSDQSCIIVPASRPDTDAQCLSSRPGMGSDHGIPKGLAERRCPTAIRGIKPCL